MPSHAFGIEVEEPEDEVLGELRVEEDPGEPMEPELDPEPMLDPPGVAPLEPPMPELPVP